MDRALAREVRRGRRIRDGRGAVGTRTAFLHMRLEPTLMQALKVAADQAVRDASAIHDGRGEVTRLVRALIVRHCEAAGMLPRRDAQ